MILVIGLIFLLFEFILANYIFSKKTIILLRFSNFMHDVHFFNLKIIFQVCGFISHLISDLVSLPNLVYI